MSGLSDLFKGSTGTQQSGSDSDRESQTDVSSGTSEYETGSSSGTSSTTGTSTTAVDVPSWLQGLIQQSAQTGQTGLADYENMVRNYQVDPTAWGALQDSASGKYLAGDTAAQKAFVDSSMRAAAPGIASMFGKAGSGTGSLAQLSLGQSGVDAFAQMYGAERDRMQQAAQAIPGIQMLPYELQKSLVQLAGQQAGDWSSLYGSTGTNTGTTTTSGTTGSSGSQQTDTSSETTESESTTNWEEVFRDPEFLKWIGAGASVLGAASGTGGLSSLLGLFGGGGSGSGSGGS